jgi:sialate O-acetylesterase
MAISGFAWYQGESNTRPQKSVADQYACDFQAMISEWRKVFQNPDAYFGFVQLSTWCCEDVFEIPQLREAQMTALELPNVGYATNADHGKGCTIHPNTKQFCGKRLGDSALGLHYGLDVHWRSPSYASTGTPVVKNGVVSVVVNLADVSDSGLTTDVYPANYVDGLDCTHNLNCTWAGIEVDGVGWLNATVMPRSDKRLALQAMLPSDTVTAADILATSYGWGPIPMMNAYDRGTHLPVLPWKQNLTETASSIFV